MTQLALFTIPPTGRLARSTGICTRCRRVLHAGQDRVHYTHLDGERAYRCAPHCPRPKQPPAS